MEKTDSLLLEIVTTIANRFKNRSWVMNTSLQKENFMPYIQAYPWDISSLSHGSPGMICLFSEMDHFFPGQGWDAVAHVIIVDLIKEMESKGVPNLSLFSGLTGILAAVQLASKNMTRYPTLLNRLIDLLLNRIEEVYLRTIAEVKLTEDPLSPFEYDLITGIAGIITALLPFQKISKVKIMLHRLVEILVTMQHPILHQGYMIPAWFVPEKYFIREEVQGNFPNGCFDTGLAHGISGCLSVISKSYLEGVVVPHHEEAILAFSSWLLNNRVGNKSFENVWPSRLGYHPLTGEMEIQLSGFYRDGWCYGAPGIASALFLASKAIKDKELEKASIDTMISVCHRSVSQRNLTCTSLCHGLGGLLTILQQFYLESHQELFHRTAKEIQNSILAVYQPELPFGFKCCASIPNNDEEILVDNAGLLDGVSGSILGLLFSTSEVIRPWTNLFAIS